MKEDKKIIRPSQCNGCSNHCPLSRPSCFIGTDYREQVWADMSDEEWEEE